MDITTADPRDSFDAAIIPGMRAELEACYIRFRSAEQDVARQWAPENRGPEARPYHERNCPGCSAAPPQGPPVVERHGIPVIECPTCRFIYSRFVMAQDDDAARYRSSTMDQALMELRELEPYVQLESARARYYLETLSLAHATKGSLLEIGCGNGTFLIEAAAMRWEVLGVEPGVAASERAAKRGIPVVNGYFPDDLATREQRFDVIVALDVLEHFENPRLFLEQIKTRLSAQGLLFLQVPNWESLLVQIEGGSSTIICPGHWSYFSSETLTRIVESAGFETLRTETIVSELDRISAYPPDKIKRTFEKIRPNISFPNSLSTLDLYNNDLGYKLIGVFRNLP